MSKLFAAGALGFSLIALLSPIGCSSDDSAPMVAEADYGAEIGKVLCDVGRSCSCSGVSASCEEDEKDSFAPPITLAKTAGLTWDSACAGKLVGVFRDALSSCSPTIDDVPVCCKLYAGPVAKGQPCSYLEQDGRRVENCAQGLRCSSVDGSGVCEELCPTLGREGDPCGDAGCAEGFSCENSGEDLTCRREARAGESCATLNCAEGLYCGQGYTCQAKGKLGSPCEYYDDCTDDLTCLEGACSKPKPAGATCTNYDECAYECFQGVCVAPSAAVCSVI